MTDEGVILVDDKFDQDYDQILASVKKVTNRPVKYVINTHHHGDHSGSNAKMLAGGVEVLMHQERTQEHDRRQDARAPRGGIRR